MRWTPAVVLVLVAGLAAEQDRQDRDPIVIAFLVDSIDREAGQSVVQEAYRRIGYEVEFRPLGAAEALAASTSGKVDAELQRIDGIDRRFPSLVQIPIPINYIQGTAFSRKYRFPVKGWNSLRPYRIGIVKGVLFAEQGTEGMNVRAARGYEELFGWMERDEIDVAILPRVEGLAGLRRGDFEGIREMEGVLETLFLYHYVHEGRHELVPLLQPVLKEMLLEGTTKRLRREAHAKILGQDS